MHSLIKWLAAYRHRSAIAAAALAGLPFLMMFSAAIVVMTVLRGGLRDGLVVTGGATLMITALQLVTRGPVLLAVLNALLVWLPAVALAVVLLRTRSLSLCLQLLAVFGLAAVGVFWLVIDNPTAWWQPMIAETYIPIMLEINPGIDAEVLAQAVARLMTGAMMAGLVLTLVIGLLAGRWFQAVLDRPGAFAEEFRGLRLGRVIGVLAAVVFVAAGIKGYPFLQNLVIVLVAVFLLQGLALAHWLVQARGLSVGWLVALYAALVVAMPWSLVFVAASGFMDNWLEIRTAETRSD